MSQATPPLRNLAKRIVAFDTKGKRVPGKNSPAPFPLPEKLQPHLATLMGNAGFRALLLRALTLSSAELPGLRALHVGADGFMAGAGEAQARLGPEKFHEGRVVLLAHLLGLLVAFIGEQLTLRLLSDVWPNLPLNRLNLGNGDENEKIS